MEWISVKDRLPEIGSSVLTYPHFKVLPFGNTNDELNHDETDTDFWEFDDKFDESRIAKPYPWFWMPLPKPPKQ